MSTTEAPSKVVTLDDVRYVDEQIMADLEQIQKAYPSMLNDKQRADASRWIMRFLRKNMVNLIGFSIYDPKANNLVYDEWNYQVQRGDEIPVELRGTQQGTGGLEITPLSLPASAIGTFLVRWSDNFRAEPKSEQENAVYGTRWSIPSQCGTFVADYSKCMKRGAGSYVSHYLAAKITRATQG